MLLFCTVLIWFTVLASQQIFKVTMWVSQFECYDFIFYSIFSEAIRSNNKSYVMPSASSSYKTGVFLFPFFLPVHVSLLSFNYKSGIRCTEWGSQLLSISNLLLLGCQFINYSYTVSHVWAILLASSSLNGKFCTSRACSCPGCDSFHRTRFLLACNPR